MRNLITHNLVLYMWKTLRKNYKFHSFRSIECKSQSVENIRKFILDNLCGSIRIPSLLDRLKKKIQSIDKQLNINQIKQIGHCFTRLIESNFRLIESCKTWIFQKFSEAVFNGFSWTNNHYMNIIDRDWYQNWISLML